MNGGVGAGPRDKAAHLIVQLQGGLAKVHGAQGLVQHGGIGVGNVILHRAGGTAAFQISNHLHQRLAAQDGQALGKGQCIFIGVECRLSAADNVACVQFLRHVHDGDTRHGIAVEDGPVNGGSTTVLRQDGRMDVDRAQARGLQNILGQDAAIGSHHRQIGVQLTDQCQSLAVTELGGLVDSQILRQGILLYRRCNHLMSAVFGTVGLGEHAADLVACFNECLQRCHGEVGRTHK